jgi:LacI family transcriptional regulator
MAEYPQVTALFCYNDLIAMGAIQACKQMGRRVPGHCSIIGFDDIQFAAMTDPSLTTVRVDKYWLGQQAASLLLKMLDSPDDSSPPVYADVKLMVRASAWHWTATRPWAWSARVGVARA